MTFINVADFERQMRLDLETYQANGIEALSDGALAGTRKRWRIYSENNWYTIVASDAGDGYIGCTSRARRERAGEDRHRGSDLADGPLTAETWHKILADIVSYEMVKVHDKAKAFKDAEIKPEHFIRRPLVSQIDPSGARTVIAAADRDGKAIHVGDWVLHKLGGTGGEVKALTKRWVYLEWDYGRQAGAFRACDLALAVQPPDEAQDGQNVSRETFSRTEFNSKPDDESEVPA